MLKNIKWEMFANAVATHGKMKQAALEAGYGPANADVRAAELMRREPVRQRVTELREKAAEKREAKLTLTRSWVLDNLMKNAQSAVEARDRSSANRALELLGREVGLFTEKRAIEVTSPLEGLDARALAGLLGRLDELDGTADQGDAPHLVDEAQPVDNVGQSGDVYPDRADPVPEPGVEPDWIDKDQAHPSTDNQTDVKIDPTDVKGAEAPRRPGREGRVGLGPNTGSGSDHPPDTTENGSGYRPDTTDPTEATAPNDTIDPITGQKYGDLV